jgi:hypothetical protein
MKVIQRRERKTRVFYRTKSLLLARKVSNFKPLHEMVKHLTFGCKAISHNKNRSQKEKMARLTYEQPDFSKFQRK